MRTIQVQLQPKQLFKIMRVPCCMVSNDKEGAKMYSVAHLSIMFWFYCVST